MSVFILAIVDTDNANSNEVKATLAPSPDGPKLVAVCQRAFGGGARS